MSGDHAELVEAWLDRVGELTPDAFVTAFERAFCRVWRRAHRMLGELTLMAIGDRVLHDATERFALVGHVRLDPRGLECSALAHAAVDPATAAETRAFARYVLMEILAALGHLTADVLTPALHAELSAEGHPDGVGGRPKTNASNEEGSDS